MKNDPLDPQLVSQILLIQKTEQTEAVLYEKLSRLAQGENREILKKLSQDEVKHYEFWKKHTQTETRPDPKLIFFYLLCARIFGITFAIKLMERGEEKAQGTYRILAEKIPEAREILQEEEEHEETLINSIEEKKLDYIGSMVLGLNDALIELTGALAGLTFALHHTLLVGVAGFITGFAASLSMASSEYLARKSEARGKNPLTAAFYTGMAYIFTVLFLVFPYFVVSQPLGALLWTLGNALLIIIVFSFFVSVVQGLSFKKHFLEMLSLSLGVALISFGVGSLFRHFIPLENL